VNTLNAIWVFGLLLCECDDVPRRQVVGAAPVAATARATDSMTVAGARHYLRGYPAQNGDDVNAVIEIPSGTTAKFEVDDADGRMHWQLDRDTGAPREIDYLPFPVNYGMVPMTLADDGDALDIVVLGRSIARGHVAKTRVIGVLMMGDDDERDDKLIAVSVEPELENGFSRLHELSDLDEQYPAALAILELWFENYWGAGATNVIGWGDADEAHAILEDAKDAFTHPRVARRIPRDVAGPHLRAPLPFAARARAPRSHAHP
jgi:inorganic pyrophosphatase